MERMLNQLAEHVGNLLPGDTVMRERVLTFLASPRWPARHGGALALLHWRGGVPQEMLRRVLDSLNDARGLESYPARLTAASYLINHDAYSQRAVAVGLEALDYGTQPWEFLRRSSEVRQQAALVLGKLEPLRYDQRVYDKLLIVLHNDPDANVRDAVYGALVRLARAKEHSAVRT